MASVVFYYHEACSLHDTGWRHPEHQGRLRAVMEAYSRARPELHGRVEAVSGSPLEPELLTRIHDGGHVERVRRAVEAASGKGGLKHLDPDTVVSPRSWDAALAAAGCVVDAVEAVATGRCRAAFCAVRPPGHHATADRAMGFCLFNNVALGARLALDRGHARRVLVVDWDVHHGNGTQDLFYRDPDVFCLSMHQSPLFPGTGAREERGAGPGEGTTLNRPVPPGRDPGEYVEILLEALDEALAGFGPDLVLVSAGFDASRGDPLGGLTLEEEHFDRLTREVVRRTGETAGGRVVSVLEGGYDVPALGALVVTHVRALAEAVGEEEGGAPAGTRSDASDGSQKSGGRS